MRKAKVKELVSISFKVLFFTLLLILILPVFAAFFAMLSVLLKYRRSIPQSFITLPHQLKRYAAQKTMSEVMEKINNIPLEPKSARLLSTIARSLTNCLPAVLETIEQTAGILYPYPNAFVPVVIQSLDGTPLCGVLAMQQCEEERPGIVLAHDFLSSKNSYEIQRIALNAYYEWGFNVFAIDFRYSGDTHRLSGAPTSWGYREAEDVLAAVKYLGSIESVGAIGVCGIGMGAASAIIAAGCDGPDAEITGGVIAISPYSNAGRTIRYISGQKGGPLGHLFSKYSLGALIKLKTATGGPYPIATPANFTREISSQYYELNEDSLYEKASPVKSIGGVNTPCLIIHSERDRVVPAGEVEELLFRARRNPMVDSIMLPFGEHGKISAVYSTWLYEAIRTFLVYWTGFDTEHENWTIGGDQLDILNNKDK